MSDPIEVRETVSVVLRAAAIDRYSDAGRVLAAMLTEAEARLHRELVDGGLEPLTATDRLLVAALGLIMVRRHTTALRELGMTAAEARDLMLEVRDAAERLIAAREPEAENSLGRYRRDDEALYGPDGDEV